MNKTQTNEKSKFKKLNMTFAGVCELRQLPQGAYFRVIDKFGQVSKTTYIKGELNETTNKYFCQNSSDVYGKGGSFKGTKKVMPSLYS